MDCESLSTTSPIKLGFVGELSVNCRDSIGGADNHQTERWYLRQTHRRRRAAGRADCGRSIGSPFGILAGAPIRNPGL